MDETAALNNSTELLITVFGGWLFQCFMVLGKNEFCLSCVLQDGSWKECACMFRDSRRGGISLSVLGMATLLFTIL